MAAKRRWSTVPATGKAVSHPVVFAELAFAYDSTIPLRVRDGVPVVTYRRTRVYLDRDAGEMLPFDGVMVIRVCPTGREPFALALTPDELEQTFGEVRESQSWSMHGCYHFPSGPPAAEAFKVRWPSRCSDD
jgi:hypothetical protein